MFRERRIDVAYYLLGEKGYEPLNAPVRKVAVNGMLREACIKVTAETLLRWGDLCQMPLGRVDDNGFVVCMRGQAPGEDMTNILIFEFRKAQDGESAKIVVNHSAFGFPKAGAPGSSFEYSNPVVELRSHKTWGDDHLIITSGDEEDHRVLVVDRNCSVYTSEKAELDSSFE